MKKIAIASLCLTLAGCSSSHVATHPQNQLADQHVASPYTLPVIYVNGAAAPGGNGKSWASAFNRLQDGLNTAATGNAEVWIAEGTYTPRGKDRNATFKVPNGVRVYGSLKAGTMDRSTSDVQRTPTFLSGNIGDPDSRIDNSYHVVTVGSNVVLDGLKITNGQANGTGFNAVGGGLILAPHVTADGRLMAPERAGITLNRVVFSDNYAMQGGAWATNGLQHARVSTSYFSNNAAISGGAVVCDGTNMELNNVHFFANKATERGGAVWFKGGSVVLHSPLFTNNTAGQAGGGAFLSTGDNPAVMSSVTIDDALFSGNRGGEFGGGVANTGAGIFNITESHMHDNFAENGGDIANLDVANSTAAGCVFIAGRGDFFGKVRSIRNRSEK